MFKNYIVRLGVLLSLLVLARLADRAQQASLAATSRAQSLKLPARGNRLNPPAAQPLAGQPAYLLVSQGGH